MGPASRHMGGPVARPGEVPWKVDPDRPRIGPCAIAALAAAIVLAGCVTTIPPSGSSSPSSPPSSSPAPELTPVPTAAINPADFTPSVIAFFDSNHGLAGGAIGTGDTAGGAPASTTGGGGAGAIRDGGSSPGSEVAGPGDKGGGAVPRGGKQAGGRGAMLHFGDPGPTSG